MAHLIIKNARLSASGKRKFDRLYDVAMKTVGATLEDIKDEIQSTATAFAPDENTERMLLSSPGTDWDFYKREGGFVYLREAMIVEDTEVKMRRNGIVEVAFGNANKINPIIGFGWYHGFTKIADMVKEQSEFRWTSDAQAGSAWFNLLQLWEYGGSFTVKPRDPDGLLTLAAHFENGKFQIDQTAEFVIKTIPAFSMYQSAGVLYQNTLRTRTMENLRRAISWL